MRKMKGGRKIEIGREEEMETRIKGKGRGKRVIERFRVKKG